MDRPALAGDARPKPLPGAPGATNGLVINGAPHPHAQGTHAAVIHPTMAFQRSGQGINIRSNPVAAASSFKASMSLMSTSLQQSSLRQGSYLNRGPTAVIGTTDSRTGPFRMSGVE